jgi:4,5:9,10-diseco-3-hydroxy-5,9,17-trioxoandrosta-1(10),2-diene-4-oate hydrolase
MTDRWSFEASSQTIGAEGEHLHVNIAGDGPPLVLLHGSGPGVSGWSNFANNLPVLGERFRVVVPDQPGYGRSYIPVLDRPYGHIASDAILRVLDELEVDKVHLLGNSMGGGTAAAFTLRHPDRVERLITMGGGGMSPSIFSPWPPEGIKRLMEFDADPTRERLVAWLETMVFDRSYITEELIEERLVNARRPGVVEWSKTLYASQRNPAAVEAVPLYAQISRITHPTLITWGLDDRVMPLDFAFFALRHLPNAELHVFSRCGHWAMIERKREFERVVLEFLSR